MKFEKPSLILVRGWPGSGKSTKAKEICSGIGDDAVHVEADMYFSRHGEYEFDHTKLDKAHEWCRFLAYWSISVGKAAVVSNTFTKKWEIEPYISIASRWKMPLYLYNCTGEYQNIHGVPDSKVEKMKRNFQALDEEYLVKNKIIVLN